MSDNDDWMPFKIVNREALRPTSIGWAIRVVFPCPDGHTAWKQCVKLVERLLGGFYEVDQQHAAERPILFVRAHHGSHECLRQCGLPASGWSSDDVHLRHRRPGVVSVPATVRMRLAPRPIITVS